jgi:hypothetical protein
VLHRSLIRHTFCMGSPLPSTFPSNLIGMLCNCFIAHVVS